MMSLTSEDLQALRSEFPTRQEFKQELERFATKEELKQELERFATKEELQQLRGETAQGFVDMRRYMQVLLEDVKSTMRVLFDGLSARIDSYGHRCTSASDIHAHRIDGLDVRVTRLENPKKRRLR